MLVWLGRRLQKRDLNSYLSILRGMPADEIGLVLAKALDFRNKYLESSGVDFLYPFIAMQQDPRLARKVSLAIQAMRKNGMPEHAGAMMIWIHTLRATVNPYIRADVIEMWSQLERGFGEIDSGTISLAATFGELPDTRGSGQFPEGFNPHNM